MKRLSANAPLNHDKNTAPDLHPSAPAEADSQPGESETSSSSAPPSPCLPPKRKPHQEHIRDYFTKRLFKRWKFSSFSTHCQAFRDYIWTHDKINNFWIKSLEQLRDEKTPLASVADIEKLLKDHRSGAHGHKSTRHAQKRKDSSLGEQEAPSVLNITAENSNISVLAKNTSTQGAAGASKVISTPIAPASNKTQPLNNPEDNKTQEPPPAPAPVTPERLPHALDTEEDNPFLVTPPAPLPTNVSGINFKSTGQSIDRWFRNVRSRLFPTCDTNSASTALRYPYLVCSNIIDLDDHRLATTIQPFCPSADLDDLDVILDHALPAIDQFVKFALERFPDPQESSISEYQTLFDTSPLPPGTTPSPRTYPAKYVNRAVEHLLTINRKALMKAAPYYREGFFDSSVNPWFIDFLFLGGKYRELILSRKEIIADTVPECTDKHDGIFRFVHDSVVFDLGVIEVSSGAANLNNDPKSYKDFGKVHRAMSGMLTKLADRVLHQWEHVRQLQVVGIVNSGWNITILRMMYITPNVMGLRTHPTRSVLREWEDIKKAFPLLELMTQCKTVMENTAEIVMKYLPE